MNDCTERANNSRYKYAYWPATRINLSLSQISWGSTDIWVTGIFGTFFPHDITLSGQTCM